MDYAVHNVPSYQHLQGTPQAAHMGSQSHNGSDGGPAGNLGMGGAMEHDPGGVTPSRIGKGSAVKLEKGAPHGMDM